MLNVLQDIFGTFGYARELVSDNGPPFFSIEFKTNIEALGTKVTNSPPYNPQSNGIVERAVQTAKTSLRKIINENKNNFQLTEALKHFLACYRNSPCTEKGFTPAEKIFSYLPRNELTKLKLDRKNLNMNYKASFEKPKVKSENCTSHENNVKDKVREFKEGENVLYISRAPGHVVGLKAIIVKKKSELTYWIKINNAQRLAHVNQLRKSALKSPIINYANIPDSFQTENTGQQKPKKEKTPIKPISQKKNTSSTKKATPRPKRNTKPIPRLNYDKL